MWLHQAAYAALMDSDNSVHSVLLMQGMFMQVVVEESVQQICALVLAGSWECSAAQDTLLAALSASGEALRLISGSAASKAAIADQIVR